MSLLLFVDLTHNNISWYILLISVYRPRNVGPQTLDTIVANMVFPEAKPLDGRHVR